MTVNVVTHHKLNEKSSAGCSNNRSLQWDGVEWELQSRRAVLCLKEGAAGCGSVVEVGSLYEQTRTPPHKTENITVP